MICRKHGSLSMNVVFIIFLVLLFSTWLIVYVQRECHTNTDCESSSYCGSDFSCHQYPEQVIVEKQSFALPALILGGAIVIAALLLKGPIRANVRRKEKTPDSASFEGYGEEMAATQEKLR